MIIDKLEKLEKESIERGIPIIGKYKGKWLYDKIKEVKPKKILELGTANGYSGIILGSEGAELTTIELDEKIANEAKNNFKEFNINAKIILGNCVEEVNILVKEKMIFDLIFIDFSKRDYIKVLEDCILLVKKNGLIIADNITMEDCKDFKYGVLNHKQLKTEIINIKDGLSCSLKLF